jgi:hypothetical protein
MSLKVSKSSVPDPLITSTDTDTDFPFSHKSAVETGNNVHTRAVRLTLAHFGLDRKYWWIFSTPLHRLKGQ